MLVEIKVNALRERYQLSLIIDPAKVTSALRTIRLICNQYAIIDLYLVSRERITVIFSPKNVGAI